MRVTVAGTIGLEADGVTVSGNVLGRHGRSALAYLVLQRHRPVTRDEMAEVLWGEDLPGSWEQMLRGVILKLRRAFSAAGLDPTTTLITSGGTYQLCLPADATVDLEEAAAALSAGEAALGCGDPAVAALHAKAAVDITARAFLPGASGMWVERRQADLRDLHLRGLDLVATAAIGRGRWPEAVIAVEQILSEEPFRESAYVTLMEAHAGCGNRAEALKTYERCRQTLANELGVSPSPSTKAAYLRVLHDGEADDAASPGAEQSMPPLPMSRRTLPASLRAASHQPRPERHPFIGRGSQLARLEAGLEEAVAGRGRISLLIGEPGIGKSRLAWELTVRAKDRGMQVAWANTDEGAEAAALWPWVNLLRPLIATADRQEIATSFGAAAGELAQILPELRKFLIELEGPPALDPDMARFRVYEALSGFLLRRAAHTPLLVVLDDLHWADCASLQLLGFLASQLRRAPILVVGTYRPLEVDSAHPLSETPCRARSSGSGGPGATKRARAR